MKPIGPHAPTAVAPAATGLRKTRRRTEGACASGPEAGIPAVVPAAGAWDRPRIRLPKAATAAECQRLEQLPNVGPALAADLRLLGISQPSDLIGRDALALYQALCRATGKRQDPCVLDTFLAVTDFMTGAQARPWWAYTAARKASYGAL